MADKKMTQLAVPEAAIASYLDELLHTATSTALEDTSVQAPPAAEAEARPRVARARVAEKPAVPLRAEAPVKVPETLVPETPEISEPVAKTVAATAIDAGSDEPPTRPDWSENPFECLIFTVAGLQLAVPLVLLGAIHRIEEEIRPIPGSPRWYMGIRPDRDHNLRVVDTAEWIMAGRVPPAARDSYRFVIRLDDSEWGLACDDVAQSFTLKPDQVRWRTARSKRPWLAGTVIDHMCALIDVRTMAHLLVRAEREHHLDLS